MPEQTQSAGWRDQIIAAVDPKRGLWRLLPAPLIAAVHFTICYISTSVYCIRSDTGNLMELRATLGWLTLAAVAAIGFCAWAAWRRLRLVRRAREGNAQRRGEVEFLSRITLYLANLSWVGVLFIAAPLVFFGACI
jgi:hypothetical protein